MSQNMPTAGGGSVRRNLPCRVQCRHPRADDQCTARSLNGTFAAEFHTSGAGLTWIAGVFMIGVVVFELSWGVLGDLFGRKKLLIAGAGLTIAGSVLAALAPVTGVMIAAQAIGGIGAGILFPISLSMIAAITPDPRARAKVIATWAGFLSLGAVISPVLAGLTSQLFTVPGANARRPQSSTAAGGWRTSWPPGWQRRCCCFPSRPRTPQHRRAASWTSPARQPWPWG